MMAGLLDRTHDPEFLVNGISEREKQDIEREAATCDERSCEELLRCFAFIEARL